MENVLIIIASAEGAIILFLGGLIATAIFRMSDNIATLTATLSSFVKKDDCKTDMGKHCKEMERLSQTLSEHMTEFAELRARSEIWHKDDK